MNAFTLKNNQLHAESVSLPDIAERFATPCYVYSRAALEASFNEFQKELSHIDSLICYAVKANSNLAVLNVFARLGAGFDIVSVGELKRALAAGADPQKIVFSGVGKSTAELAFALHKDILCFNVESAPELSRLNEVAASLGKRAPVSLRVNPDVDAKTHPYISTGLKENKFGVAYNEALDLYRYAAACRISKSPASTAISARNCWTPPRLPKRSTNCWRSSINWPDMASNYTTSTSAAASASATRMRTRQASAPICTRCCTNSRTENSRCWSSRAGDWSAMPVHCSRASNTSSRAKSKISPSSMQP